MRRVLAFVLFHMIVLSVGTALADDDVFVIEMEPTPTPVAPTAPPTPTPRPVIIISKFDNDLKTIDIAARAAYYSPFDVLYWKFVYWCVMYNRTQCNVTIDGVRRYSSVFVEVATNKHEFETWNDDMPYSNRGKEILHLNNIAANLFFDYIKSGGAGYIVPMDGVILEYVRDSNGMNRSANVYNLDGTKLTLMTREEFANTIEKEYYRRIGPNAS